MSLYPTGPTSEKGKNLTFLCLIKGGGGSKYNFWNVSPPKSPYYDPPHFMGFFPKGSKASIF